MTVWGLDISTKCIALAIDREPRSWWFTLPLQHHLRGAQRLASTHRRVDHWLRDSKTHFPPDAVFVEMPAGRHVAPTLIHHVGVVLAVLGNTVECPVVELSVSRWKQLAVGTGGATKDMTLQWARKRGYTGTSYDEADAIGIAAAGRMLLDRELELAA